MGSFHPARLNNRRRLCVVIGQGAVIGGNVFITSSVPPLNQVSAEPPKLKYRDRRPKSAKSEVILDFQI